MTTHPFPRHIETWEWTQLGGPSFPGLKEADVIATGDSTILYNCIAFSLGRTDRWIEPDTSIDNTSLAKTLALYKYHGYVPGNEATAVIDIWTRKENGITIVQHASRRDGTTDVWESKMGSSLRIRHDRKALANGSYGSIEASLVKQEALPALDFYTVEDAKDATVTRYLKNLEEAHPNLKSQFETKYAAWKAVWYKDGLAMRSEMSLRKDDSHCLGPYMGLMDIKLHHMLPFLVEKLGGADDVFSIQLYEGQQPDSKLKIPSTDYFNYLDILNRRVATFRLYAGFVQKFDDCVTDWRKNKNASSIVNALKLFQRPPPAGWDSQILPLVMAEYSKHQLDEPWDKILPLLAEDEEPKMSTWKYAEWKVWFEKP